jgi:hypothetical protein
MIPQTCPDEETLENDVRYGIADCRKRLRGQRATLRTQHHPLTDVPNCEKSVSAARGIQSYAEIFAVVSMNQSSISKLVECLLDPVDKKVVPEESAEQEEAELGEG